MKDVVFCNGSKKDMKKERRNRMPRRSRRKEKHSAAAVS